MPAQVACLLCSGRVACLLSLLGQHAQVACLLRVVCLLKLACSGRVACPARVACLLKVACLLR